MQQIRTLAVGGLALAMLITAIPAGAALTAETQFLSGPAQGQPLDVAIGYLDTARANLNLTASDVQGLVVSKQYQSRHNGTTHIYLKQSIHGLEVANRPLNINIAQDGSVINVGGRAFHNLAAAATAPTPSLSPERAIEAAARGLDLKITAPLVADGLATSTQGLSFRGAGLSLDNISPRLTYFASEKETLHLAWELQIRTTAQDHWWNLWIDAQSGEILGRVDWMAHDNYEVFAFPKEHPNDGPRTIESNVANSLASPFGWHDTDGVAGAEFTDTRGNNVFAQEDRDANNSGGFRPSGGGALSFNFPLDLNQAPSTYQEAAIANLFYANNIIHDILYHYGFDEASGNFQQNNYGRGGSAGDPVQADAQDGSGTNNANFGTPPDGSDPRMQMFEWTPVADHLVTINAPGSIAGDYVAAGAAFGPTLTTTGITGNIALANDGTGDTADGCEALTNGAQINGNIALMDRGSCSFTVKVKNAQNAGAIAAIVANNGGDAVIAMGGTDNTVTISSVFIGQSDGTTLKGELGNGLNGTVKFAPNSVPARDSDLDNGIIAHEYGHGLSTRLTGGAGNSNCLSGNQQAGEGWSDFLALVLTAKAGDLATDPRGIGTYVVFEPTTGVGIRDFPYSTDLNVNPHVYEDIGGVSIPHGVGSVWAAATWEVYWNLVGAYGFDADLYNGTGGNNLALQLVIDGLKLQGCSPTFLDARDAILLADQTNNGGANQCLIWEGFAKRGMGVSANDGGGSNSLAVTNGFDVPAACLQTCGNNVVEGTEVCDGSDLGGQTCGDFGCTGGGTLACNNSCDGFDTSSCFTCPACDFDGVCELGEDCNGCPSDCVGGTSSGAICGNGICEAGNGEDCLSCAQDCNGRQNGNPGRRFCCGDGDGQNPVACSDSRCSTGGFSCTDVPVNPGSFCCGDLTCGTGESCGNCALDCTSGAELCGDGVDNDCDGNIDCDDLDCLTDPSCNGGGCTLGQPGDSCTANSQCCSNKCRGPNGNKSCR